MEHSSNNSVTEFQQLWGSWTAVLNRAYEDPRVSQLMNTRIGLYLSSHPVSALAVLLFSTMAALPVGLFLTFALVTIIMSAVGFVFFEAFLLFVGGLTLLCVLSSIALFSFVVSVIFSVFYVTVSNILKAYYPHLTKLLISVGMFQWRGVMSARSPKIESKVQEEESETSKLKETQ